MQNKFMALALGFVFFIVGVATLPHYGVNWDTINHLPRGQAYLHFFLTGEKDYASLPQYKEYWQDPDSLTPSKDSVPRRSLYQNSGTTFTWFIGNERGGHPPLSDILSSLFNVILYQKLGIVNDIDAYRVYGVFLSAVLVGLVFWWTGKLYGKFAGLVASVSLSLYPLFWAESHFNGEKDIPETSYWAFLLFCVWMGFREKSWKWIMASGIFFGLALGTKFNVLFSVFVIIPWVVIYLNKNLNRHTKLLAFCLLSAILGILIFFLTWPYLWGDPLSSVVQVVNYYKTLGLTVSRDARFIGPLGLNTYPATWIIFTTPLVILFFFTIGLLSAAFRVFRRKDRDSVLILLWLLVPILRVTLPGTTIYGGVRQIMEYIPAMAILAGLGAQYLISNIKYQISKTHIKNFKILELPTSLNSEKIFTGSFLLFTFAFLLYPIIRTHPNENVYFNPLIGGLAGARERDIPSWGNSFGAAYRQGVSWINKNSEKGARVVLAYELLPNIPNIFIRSDISFHNLARSGYLRAGEYAITLTYDGTTERSYYDSYLEKFIEPVYQAKVDGVSILKVWKNDDAHLKVPWKETAIETASYKRNDSGLIFDLSDTYKVSRLEIDYDEANCKKLSSGVVKITKDGQRWETLPGILPNTWKISALREQPSNGHFIEPFVGQEAKFIELVLFPKDTCLKNIKSFKIFRLF